MAVATAASGSNATRTETGARGRISGSRHLQRHGWLVLQHRIAVGADRNCPWDCFARTDQERPGAQHWQAAVDRWNRVGWDLRCLLDPDFRAIWNGDFHGKPESLKSAAKNGNEALSHLQPDI